MTGAPHTETISAQFDTVSGTATAGIDFEAVSGRVEFVRGQTQQTIRIPIMEVLLVLPTYLLLPASLLTTYDLLPYSRTYPLPSLRDLRDSLTYSLTYELAYIIEDEEVEGTEHFFVQLSEPCKGARIGPAASCAVTIEDSDSHGVRAVATSTLLPLLHPPASPHSPHSPHPLRSPRSPHSPRSPRPPRPLTPLPTY